MEGGCEKERGNDEGRKEGRKEGGRGGKDDRERESNLQQERLIEWVGNERKKRGKKQEKSWEKKEGRKERPDKK